MKNPISATEKVQLLFQELEIHVVWWSEEQRVARRPRISRRILMTFCQLARKLHSIRIHVHLPGLLSTSLLPVPNLTSSIPPLLLLLLQLFFCCMSLCSWNEFSCLAIGSWFLGSSGGDDDDGDSYDSGQPAKMVVLLLRSHMHVHLCGTRSRRTTKKWKRDRTE